MHRTRNNILARHFASTSCMFKCLKTAPVAGSEKIHCVAKISRANFNSPPNPNAVLVLGCGRRLSRTTLASHHSSQGTDQCLSFLNHFVTARPGLRLCQVKAPKYCSCGNRDRRSNATCPKCVPISTFFWQRKQLPGFGRPPAEIQAMCNF